MDAGDGWVGKEGAEKRASDQSARVQATYFHMIRMPATEATRYSSSVAMLQYLLSPTQEIGTQTQDMYHEKSTFSGQAKSHEVDRNACLL